MSEASRGHRPLLVSQERTRRVAVTGKRATLGDRRDAQGADRSASAGSRPERERREGTESCPALDDNPPLELPGSGLSAQTYAPVDVGEGTRKQGLRGKYQGRHDGYANGALAPFSRAAKRSIQP